ncbi:MAG: hypothetical protein IPO83_03945 [Chitinophagaceae bacterium]|nr:hypothetical protein [Chitinophagaceae bacterium]
MKSIWFFLKTTVKGGALFFLPIIFLIIAVEKVIKIFTGIISPVAEKLGIDTIAGKATISILIVIVVLLICFLGGMLMRIKVLQKLNQVLDEKLATLVPAYSELKSKTTGKLDSLAEASLKESKAAEK